MKNVKITGKYKQKFTNKNTGSIRFLYTISGTEAALEAYKAAEGDYYSEDKDTGKPLYYSNRYSGEFIELGITEAGKIFVNDEEIAKLASLAEQNPLLADAIANRMLDKLLGGKSAAQPAAKAVEPTAEVEPEAEEPDGEL